MLQAAVARAHGLSGLSDWLDGSGYSFSDPGSWSVISGEGGSDSSSGGHSTRDLVLGTINNSFPLLASIFGKNPAVTTYSNPNAQAAYYGEGSNAPGSQISQGLGAGIQGTLQGIGNFLGVSSTTVIIGSAFGLYLLFRQPPRRR